MTTSPSQPARRVDARLVDANGDVRFGVFDGPIDEINYRDYDLWNAMDRPRGALARHFGFNQFQFLGALGEGLVLGCGLVDIRLLGQAFLYLYEPATRRFATFSLRSPLALGSRTDQRPEDGSASFRQGKNRLAMTATREPQRRHLWVRLAAGVEIDAVFDESDAGSDHAIEPMRLCTPAGMAGFVYAHKTAGARVSGTVLWDGRRYDLGALGLLGHHDWSAGYMRRETFWNWGCVATRLPDGRVVGMNVSCGVNETSHTESCFWIDGRLHRLGSVAFEYDRRDLNRPWRLRDVNGRLDLAFIPEGSHAEKTNAFVLAANFQQMFGRWSGTLTTPEGETVLLDEALGYAERHYAKW